MKKIAKQVPDTAGLMHRLTREAVLIVYSLAALILLISLLTYSATDPGFTTTGSGGEVSNAVGRYGAWFADFLLQLFGYLAYLFPAFLAYQVYRSFRETELERQFSWPFYLLKALGFMLVILAASGLFTLHFNSTDSAPYLTGGLTGDLISSVAVPVFAILGSTLLFMAILLFGITITAEISWLKVVDTLGATVLFAVSALRERYRNWQDQREAAITARERTENRKKVLDVHIAKEKKRSPPTIALTPPVSSGSSKRVEQEKQGRLFKTATLSELPAIGLLDVAQDTGSKGFSRESLEAMSKLLELKLKDFGIDIEVTAVNPGPVITRFEVQPAPGVKVSRISNLVKDLARSLAVISVRVVEVIPGKTVIGIEIPNESREMILLSQVLASAEFDKASSALSLALGYDIVGKPVIVDLAKMPHLLVAGTTGSGKSVGLNAMILSLLFKSTPEQVRMIMIDPKMLELSVYEGIPHLLTPVITDMKDAANGLRWSVAEMERRYKLMSTLGVRNLAGFNKKVIDAKKSGKPILNPFWQPDPMLLIDDQAPAELEPLPCIVVIVDELADMMMVVGKKVEELIARIAQKARAAGIHLIIATQRPSVDVLTGLIKANIPTRVAFMVQSKIDSRTILGEGGAEQLLGHGDMLLLPPGGGVATRVHGAFVSDEEVHRVVADWKQRGEPVYIEDITQGSDEVDFGNMGNPMGTNDEDDALYDEAVRFVTESRKASISAVQRKLRIGYNRAARMIETMEASGVVSGMSTNGSREVIAPPPPRN